MNIEYISVSRKSVWDTCVEQYKFKYHLKVPVENEPFYFVYGKIIHKVAEVFVQSKGEMLTEEISRDILKGKIPLEKNKEGDPKFAPPLPDEYKKRLKMQLMQNLLKKTFNTKKMTLICIHF